MSKRVKLTTDESSDTSEESSYEADSDFVDDTISTISTESEDDEDDKDDDDYTQEDLAELLKKYKSMYNIDNVNITLNMGDILNNYDENEENSEEEEEEEENEEVKQVKIKVKIPNNDISNFVFNKIPVNNLKDLIFALDHIDALPMQKELLGVCKDLDSTIGMDDLKNKITTQIISIIQGLLKKDTLMNTVITGNTGTGKTKIIEILARIYKALGYLQTNKITVVNRSQLIAAYLGQTAAKTEAVLKSALGGVLVIDEVYSLYTSKEGAGDDEYGRECLNTINQFLTEHPDLICIVAGYATDIENCFFRINQGLRRRFAWAFNINDYNPTELCDIFYNQLERDDRWKIDIKKTDMLELITKNAQYLKHNGGDMKELLDKSKLLYARRAFNEGIKTHMISEEDVKSAMTTLINMKNDMTVHDECTFCKEIAKTVKESKNCKKCTKNVYSYIS